MDPNSTLLINPHPASYETELRRLLESFSNLLLSHGIEVEAYTYESMARFSSYPIEVQTRIYNGFIKYVSAVAEIIESGIPLENTPQSLWCLYKKYHLRPKADLFSVITDRDIVEIYLPNQVQWYRSFNYFKYSSYSLGELICYPWDELISHETDHTSQFVDITEGIFANKITWSVFPELGYTISRERFSRKRFTARLRPKVISPVVNAAGENQAFAIAWEIELIDEPRTDSTTHPVHSPLQTAINFMENIKNETR